MSEIPVRHFAACLGLLLAAASSCRAAGLEEQGVGQLRREVAERERQLARAQRGLAEARARLALAEGRREAAIGEFRKAVAACQDEIQWIRAHANWWCDPREPMDEAQWDLAQARVRLAEAEGDAAGLAAAWRTIVGFQEQRLERVRRLEQMRAVKPEEMKPALQALEEARRRLDAAEKRLAAERPKPPEKPK